MPEIIPPNIISRLQWSRRGITAYDENGSFVFRLEGWMCPMFTAGIVATLGRIEQERVRRSTYKSKGEANATVQKVQEPSAGEGSIRRVPGAADAAGSGSQSQSDGTAQELAAAREEVAEEAVGGVPV